MHAVHAITAHHTSIPSPPLHAARGKTMSLCTGNQEVTSHPGRPNVGTYISSIPSFSRELASSCLSCQLTEGISESSIVDIYSHRVIQ